MRAAAGESGAGQLGRLRMLPPMAPGCNLSASPPPTPLRKVVRRASLSDRTNLYRKEYEGEAILWQQRSAAEDQRTSTYNGDIRETRTDQENKDPVSACLLPGPRLGRCHGRGTGPQPGVASSSQSLQREVSWPVPLNQLDPV